MSRDLLLPGRGIAFVIIACMLSLACIADSYSNQASHSTLYTDTITSKTDGSPVRVADSEGFQVTTGNVGIGTTSPAYALDVGVGSTSWNNWKSYGPNIVSNSFTGPGIQRINARASGYAAVAARNPGLSFSIYLVPWDGSNDLEYNCQHQINTVWHAQAVVKGNYFYQTFDNNDFTQYSTVILSQEEFDNYKHLGTQWWIICSTLDPYYQSSGSSSQWVTSGSNIYYNSGNVGIGTTGPNYKLDVNGGIGFTGNGADVPANRGSVGGGDRVTLYRDITQEGVIGYQDGAMYFKAQHSDSSAESFRFYGGSAVPVELMRVTGNGNVGIGTANPTFKLDVEGLARVTSILQIGNDPGLTIQPATTEVRLYSNFGKNIWINPSNEGTFMVGGSGIYQSTSGNVGIGTTNPDSKLDVVGGQIRVQSSESPTTGAGMELKYASATGADVLSYNRDTSSFNNLRLRAAYVLINEGNLGIGTTNPGSKATVKDGDVYVSTQGNGLILKDTSDGTCRRVVLTSGSLSVSGTIACPST